MEKESAVCYKDFNEEDLSIYDRLILAEDDVKQGRVQVLNDAFDDIRKELNNYIL